MKDWSSTWKSSRKKAKQRKYIFAAPLHTRNKLVSAHLSKELAKRYKTRNVPTRKGDKVKVMRGQFRGTTGKINRVDLKRLRLFIDGVEQTKIDGSKAFYPVHPSNVMITELNTEDNRRMKRMKVQ